MQATNISNAAAAREAAAVSAGSNKVSGDKSGKHSGFDAAMESILALLDKPVKDGRRASSGTDSVEGKPSADSGAVVAERETVDLSGIKPKDEHVEGFRPESPGEEEENTGPVGSAGVVLGAALLTEQVWQDSANAKSGKAQPQPAATMNQAQPAMPQQTSAQQAGEQQNIPGQNPQQTGGPQNIAQQTMMPQAVPQQTVIRTMAEPTAMPALPVEQAVETEMNQSQAKPVTLVLENQAAKPELQAYMKASAAEQQRNPELAYQAAQENRPQQNKGGASAMEEGKGISFNNTTVVDKVEPGSGSGASGNQGNATTNSAPLTGQAVPVADSFKGVPLTELRDRVLQEIRFIHNTVGSGDRQMQVHLKLVPENLGQLTIKLYFNKGELNAHFYTANNSVREVVESSLQQLRTSLSQQDMKLNEAFVFVGNGNQNQGQAGPAAHEQKNQGNTGIYGTADYTGEDDHAVEAGPESLIDTSSGQVNYLV